MGVTIRQKTKGKGAPWWVFISYNGKRTSKKVGTKSAAEKVKEEIEARLKLNQYDFKENKKVPLFKDYAKEWIETTVPATCKESSEKDYDDILRLHVLPAFGDLNVTEITRGQIKNFLFAKINEGKAKSTVNHYRAVISGVLNQAVDDGVILANPTHRLGRVGKKETANNIIDPLTRDELKKLLDTVQVHFKKEYPLFLLLGRTGIRIGETLALKWNDIDFSGRSIEIERTVYKGRVGTPKNGKSRTIDMSWQLRDALFQLKQSKVVVSIDEDEDWVFTNGSGSLIDADNWRRRIFKPALKKAKLRKIRIHDLRHTYATLRLNKGDNIIDVANQLGDDIKVVLDVYSHWMPGKKKDEVDALDDAEYMQQDHTDTEKQANES
jgi:integrase